MPTSPPSWGPNGSSAGWAPEAWAGSTWAAAPADARSSSASASASTGSLPQRYVGTWEGQAAALDGKLPLGTFRITMKRVNVGQELGRLHQTDALGGVCVDVLTLKKVTGKQIVAGSVGAEGNHDGCNPAPTTATFAPVGDDLDYASRSEESGRPEARLSRIG
ncbi:hypothetical protein [Streptomyces olivaceus]|uniref:hypothetical protein n=1 Tax=Streptomyces olivaceus TaxID=47716 RepID=UPI0033AF44EE